jgi:hypothetical protein
MAIPLYGLAIQDAIASRDLVKMRTMVPRAEKYLRTASEVRGYGEGDGDGADPDAVAEALEELKAEIAKMEGDG